MAGAVRPGRLGAMIKITPRGVRLVWVNQRQCTPVAVCAHANQFYLISSNQRDYTDKESQETGGEMISWCVGVLTSSNYTYHRGKYLEWVQILVPDVQYWVHSVALYFKESHIGVIPDGRITVAQVDDTPHVRAKPDGRTNVGLILANQNRMRHR